MADEEFHLIELLVALGFLCCQQSNQFGGHASQLLQEGPYPPEWTPEELGFISQFYSP